MKLLAQFAALLFVAFGSGALCQQLETHSPSCDARTIEKARAGAKAGDGAALYLMARYFSTGKCVPGDGRRAVELYTNAAAKLYPPAFYNLGMIAAANQDFAVAEKFFLRGAELGHRGAELQLGILYMLVPPPVGDDAKAYAWLTLTKGRDEVVSDEASHPLAIVVKRMNETSRQTAEALAKRIKAKFGSIAPFPEPQ